MIQLLLIVLTTLFSIQAIRARALISSALWLAGVSALMAMTLNLLGARLLAVLELSVGTGLVTILFVLAINIAGDVPVPTRSILPGWLVIGMSILPILVAGWIFFTALPVSGNFGAEIGISTEIQWQERGMDILLQVLIIFAGVLGFLGLLAETRAPLDGSVAASFVRRREQDLQALEDLGRLPGGGPK